MPLVISLTRSLVYLIVVYSFGLLANLYFYAYREKKESRILYWLAMLFTIIAVFFMMLAIIAYTLHLSRPAYDLLVSLLIIPSSLLVVVAYKFKEESLRSNGHKNITKLKVK